MGIEAANAPIHLPVIIGTAGHIDHGKSSLVRALTGTDPDRLKEEKERGITIDLGFAFLDDRIAFIDVPGHEHFIKNMVAGAATVDFALLVVAADDGVMPQTREHLDILNLLDVRGGLVVITKADMVDPSLADMARDEAMALCKGTVLDGASAHIVDSLSGKGIPALRQAIVDLAAGKRVRGGTGGFRMPVDRVFTMKGFGTVVTGSVLSGTARTDDRSMLLPDGTEVRIRGVQSHSRTVGQVVAGQRAALNLVGVAVEDVRRGDVLATAGTLETTRRMLVRIDLLASAPTPLEDRQRVHLHIGTADLVARVALLESAPIPPGGSGYAELRLESPTASRRPDRFILRRFSPVTTIGGGTVLDPAPPPGRRPRSVLRELAVDLDSNDAGVQVVAVFERKPFSTDAEASAALAQPLDDVAPRILDRVAAGDLFAFPVGTGTRYATAARVQTLLQAAGAELAAFHDKSPLRAGMSRSELASRLQRQLPEGTAAAFLDRVIALGFLDGPSPRTVAALGFEVRLTRKQREAVAVLERALLDGALMPPSVEDLAAVVDLPVKEARVLLTFLADTDRALCLDGTLYFAIAPVHQARQRLADLFAVEAEVATSRIRDVLGTTRKYLIPLLQHFDELRWTVRHDDVRRAGPRLAEPSSCPRAATPASREQETP